MSREGQDKVKARSKRGRSKVKDRSRQRKHNLKCNYNLMGFDTIEINLVILKNLFNLKNMHEILSVSIGTIFLFPVCDHIRCSVLTYPGNGLTNDVVPPCMDMWG